MNFQVSHIFREGNQVADMLSKHALEHHADSWWFSAPPFCYSLVGNDCMGSSLFIFLDVFFFFLVWPACLFLFGVVFPGSLCFVAFCHFLLSFISFIYGYCLGVFQHMIACDAFSP